MGHRPVVERGEQILDREVGHPLARACRVAEPMWGTTIRFGALEQRVIARERLGIGHVERRTGDRALDQRLTQRGLVDDRRRARC